MFNKKFKLVLFLGVIIILLIVFGKKLVNGVTSMDNISGMTESTSLSYYKKSCEYGNSKICNELGNMYQFSRKGDLVSLDYEEAVNYYKKSCGFADGLGCNNLAYMINQGLGISKNNWTAIRLYKKACKYKEFKACYNVGSMYYHGEGTKRNYYNAIQYFEESCTEHIGAGCNDLGYMYEHGVYFRRNTTKAMAYYRDSCERDEPLGCRNLGYLRNKMGHIVPARQFFKKACLLGDNHSCNRLESILGSKIYEIKDEEALLEAKNACNRSTEGGTMCYRVGLYYEKIYKESKDKDDQNKARIFLEKACDRQQSQSCKHLGDLHR